MVSFRRKKQENRRPWEPGTVTEYQPGDNFLGWWLQWQRGTALSIQLVKKAAKLAWPNEVEHTQMNRAALFHYRLYSGNLGRWGDPLGHLRIYFCNPYTTWSKEPQLKYSHQMRATCLKMWHATVKQSTLDAWAQRLFFQARPELAPFCQEK